MPTKVRITTLAGTGEPIATLSADYHPDCAPRARSLGGKWNAEQKLWIFDVRDLERVKGLALDIYGETGMPDEPVADTVTIRLVTAKGAWADKSAVYFAGRSIASASGRDSNARLGGGVIQLEGDHPAGGGSGKNWGTQIHPAAFEVRDLPRAKVEAEIVAIAEQQAEYEATYQKQVAEGPKPCWACLKSPGLQYGGPSACKICKGTALASAPVRQTTTWVAEILEDVPTRAAVAAATGAPLQQSPTEQAWAAIEALDEAGQVEIRNRLLAKL